MRIGRCSGIARSRRAGPRRVFAARLPAPIAAAGLVFRAHAPKQGLRPSKPNASRRVGSYKCTILRHPRPRRRDTRIAVYIPALAETRFFLAPGNRQPLRAVKPAGSSNSRFAPSTLLGVELFLYFDHSSDRKRQQSVMSRVAVGTTTESKGRLGRSTAPRNSQNSCGLRTEQVFGIFDRRRSLHNEPSSVAPIDRQAIESTNADLPSPPSSKGIRYGSNLPASPEGSGLRVSSLLSRSRLHGANSKS
jgi:hypothetical protein